MWVFSTQSERFPTSTLFKMTAINLSKFTGYLDKEILLPISKFPLKIFGVNWIKDLHKLEFYNNSPISRTLIGWFSSSIRRQTCTRSFMQMSYLYASDLPFKNFIYSPYLTSFKSCLLWNQLPTVRDINLLIGSGRDCKAWLIFTFTLFTKTCQWRGN